MKNKNYVKNFIYFYEAVFVIIMLCKKPQLTFDSGSYSSPSAQLNGIASPFTHKKYELHSFGLGTLPKTPSGQGLNATPSVVVCKSGVVLLLSISDESVVGSGVVAPVVVVPSLLVVELVTALSVVVCVVVVDWELSGVVPGPAVEPEPRVQPPSAIATHVYGERI